ncbi:MAG TPA: DUF5689 domain-containing protein [Ferruginibacter sp.]|nr:DUF5689 domain-containing protein [Ferruginibacter sp.]
MNRFFKISLVAIFLSGFAILLNSCKKEFDSPSGPKDQDIVANTTIADLKAMHPGNGAYTIVGTDIIISGIVVANDKSGNLYKQLYIEDATGGLQILLDAASLYGSYPIGRRIYIKCKGLCLSDYNRLMALGVKANVAGLPSQEGIPSALINQYVIGGSLGNAVTPHAVTLNDLTTNMQDRYLGSLIQLEGFYFSNVNQTYSDTSAYKATQNRDIKNCDGLTTIIRTSAYANFAGQRVAQGRGSVTAIYTVFGNTKQLLIRDTGDVKFNEPYDCPLPAGVLFQEDFEGQVTPGPLVLNNWFVGAEAGTKTWEARLFSSNKYAQMSAFSTNDASAKAWMVTKAINLGTFASKTLTFETNAGFHNGAVLKLLISTDYSGTGNPWASGVNWTDISSSATFSPGLPSGYPPSFTPSGNVDLSSYSGTVYIAFKYEGADPSGSSSDKTTTWQVDKIKVTGL